MTRWLAFLLPVLAGHPALAQRTVPPDLRDMTLPAEPDSYADAQLGVTLTQGAFPAKGMFGGDIQPTSETFSVRRQVAASSRTHSAPVALAGYANTVSARNGAVGVFGRGTTGADAPGVWGGNFLAANCPAADVFCQTGHDTIVYGAEFDVNVAPLPGGAAPAGAAYGIHISGASAIRPLGGAVAVHIDPLNGYLRGVRWTAGLRTEDGAADRGIVIGALANSVDPMDGDGRSVAAARPRDSGNQGLFLNGIDRAGVPHQAYVTADGDANLILSAGQRDGIVEVGTGPGQLKVSAAGVQVMGTVAVAGPAPSVADAPGARIAPGSNDTRGAVTIPPGLTTCRIAFGARYETAPFAVVSGDVPGVAVAVLATQAATGAANGSMTIGLPAGLRVAVTVTWHVIQ